MDICDFAYHRPTTVSEAIELGQSCGESARFLAGGTELLVLLKQHRITTEHLISLERLSELTSIALVEESGSGEFLRIGALATLTKVAESPVVRAVFPPLVEAVMTMASVQIRNQATIGGNFCAAVPCADTPPICIVAGAELCLSGTSGERILAAEEFFSGPRQTVLQPGEILTEIRIPAQSAHSGASYQRFARRVATLALAGSAVMVALEGEHIGRAKIALSAVAPTPLLAEQAASALIGERPSKELFDEVASIAAREAQPISDVRGTDAFRRSLVKTLTRRACQEAVNRASSESLPANR